jgi:hypothetical protein
VGRLEQRALVVGMIGLVGCIAGWIMNSTGFYRAYQAARSGFAGFVCAAGTVSAGRFRHEDPLQQP